MLNTKFMNDDAQEVDDTVLIIEQALARSGLTKAQLCRELGISPSRYNNWRSCLKFPRIYTIRFCADQTKC